MSSATPNTSAIPVVSGVFEPTDEGVVLLGSRCAACGRIAFPEAPACPSCASSEVSSIRLGAGGGTLWAWTLVQAAPPGYTGPVPYGFGIAELAEGIRVVGRIVAEPFDLCTFGAPVSVGIDVVGEDEDGRARVTWAFHVLAGASPPA